jgi:hypothetical protein
MIATVAAMAHMQISAETIYDSAQRIRRLAHEFWNSYAFETRFERLRRDRRRAGSLVRATDEKGFVTY